MTDQTTDRKTGLLPYRHSLAGTLLGAREAVMDPIRPFLRDAGVTEQQWRVLRVVNDEGSIDASSLADAAMLHGPSVTRILRELKDRGLIERRIDPADGRRSIIGITVEGQKLVHETARQTRAILEHYADIFGSDRVAALRAELIAFTAAIRVVGPAVRAD